jgi:hypothetical protein
MVVILGSRRDHRCAVFALADVIENDLGAEFVELDWAFDLDAAPGQAAYVAGIVRMVRENHDCERAGHLVSAEIEKGNAFGADFHTQDSSGYAFGRSDVLLGFVDG